MPIFDAHGHTLLCLFCARPRFMVRAPARDYTSRKGVRHFAYVCEVCDAFDTVAARPEQQPQRLAA